MKGRKISVGVALLCLLFASLLPIAAQDTNVTGGTATPMVSRTLPSGDQTAGSTITVTLDVVVGSATYYAIDEEVPAGWAVTNVSGSGDYTAQPGHVKWVVITGASDKTYTYNVTIPVDAAGDYEFSGIFAMEGVAETSIGGNFSLTIEGSGTSSPKPTPSPTATPTPAQTSSPTSTLTHTPSPSPTSTVTPSPSPAPTPTSIPSPSPSPVPTTSSAPTATPEEPGFEAIFAITGLSAIAYLVLRRKWK